MISTNTGAIKCYGTQRKVDSIRKKVMRKAAKDIFPTLECCILMAEIIAAYGFFFVLAMQR